MNSLKPLAQIAENPYRYARKWKEKTGRPVVGYLCSYTPEEILHAAGVLPLRLFGGVLPLRLFGGSAGASAADRHLQAYSCSLARGVLADALSGELSFLSGAVFPHTCDTIQRLSDLWRMNAGFSFHFDVALPVKLDTESARSYLSEVFRRFSADLEAAFGVALTEERLSSAIDSLERSRRAIRRLYRIRSGRPGAMSGAVLETALRAAAVADRGELPAMLEALAREVEESSEKSDPTPPKKRLVLSGGLCRTPDIHRIVEAAGAVVVDDDLCTGRRFFDGSLSPGKDPLAAVARRYADRIVCPAKHRGKEERSRRLVSQVRENGAQGVIFFLLKFCDPHGFDYPHLKSALDRENVPSLLLETEDPANVGGQAATRIEAFIETLQK